MRIISMLLLSHALASPPRVPDRSATATVRVATDTVDALGWLVGKWTAVEPGDGGDSTFVVMNCAWLTTHHGIAFDVAFANGRGGAFKAHYDGVYYWDPDQRTLASWQIDEKGQVARAAVTLTRNGFDQVTRIAHPDGSAHFTKTHLEQIDASSFRLTGFFRPETSTDWMPAIDQVYRRAR
jgi:hypothetical protein